MRRKMETVGEVADDGSWRKWMGVFHWGGRLWKRMICSWGSWRGSRRCARGGR